MKFRKYQHVERYGTTEVDGIALGTVYVFSKIDGTNSSLWLDEGILKAGSRTRELSLEKDNAGFYAYAMNEPKFKVYLDKHPTHRLYGEWLVPHTIKNYKDNAWRNFYVFDVVEEFNERHFRYVPYDEYKPLLEEFDIEYIEPIAVIENGTRDTFESLLDSATFLTKEGTVGEGIVLHNYDFINRYGRTVWAKIVRSEFRQQKEHKVKNDIEHKNNIEYKIVNNLCTPAFIEKEYQKLLNEVDGEWNSKMIPKLLNHIFHEFVAEETWNIIKKYKFPVIDFKLLNILVIEKVKEYKKELF